MGMLFTAFGGMSMIGKLIAVAVVVGSLLTAYGVWRHTIYMKGWRAHEAAIARQDARTIAATKRARDVFNDCRAHGLRWDQSTGQCGGR